MSVLSQKEAVFSAVTSVLTEAGVNSNALETTPASNLLTSELRAQAISILVEGFSVTKNIALNTNFSNTDELKNYCSSLLSNWLRKDMRLNGGEKYVAKNPGSRSGSTDGQIKAMRILLSTKTDPQERAEIQSFIDKRLLELRTKDQQIDVDALPVSLREKFLNNT